MNVDKKTLEILRDPKEEEVLVFDLESNHYDFDIINVIHCIAIGCYKTRKVDLYVTPTEKREAIQRLNKAKVVAGHNTCKFDIPALQMFYPEFKPACNVDTLILSKLAKPSLFSHSLETWGTLLKCAKGDYVKEFKERAGKEYTKGDEWLEYSPEMGAYNIQDVVVNLGILESVLKAEGLMYPWSAFELEAYVAQRVLDFERIGVGFDVKKAEELYSTLLDEREQIESQLREQFAGFFKKGAEFIPKRDNKKLGYTKGSPMTKVTYEEFNPSSRQHVERYLKKLFDWEPVVFTDGGQAKINDEILESLAEYIPEAGLIARYFMLSKRLSQLATAEGSWLNKVKDGRIHGKINTVGTTTFRCSHNTPNLGQVPSGEKPFGYECREMFSHGFDDTWAFLGCDQSGIEARLLGHYCAQFDGGALNKIILDGDIHTHNQKLAGLPTRAQAKTFFYALMYGSGDSALGVKLGGNRWTGAKAREKFMRNMPAFSTLLARMEFYKGNRTKDKKPIRPKFMDKHLKCLDGRHIHCPNNHTTLNYVLQSAGAILSKEWVRQFDILLESEGLTDKVHVLLWVHDELQMAVKKDVADRVGELCIKAIEIAGEMYKLRIPITGEYNVGNSWRDTH
jgi:DNA polymerase I-like protein with 3'-5' exonuclease and polymerase domains